jgi:hypothetical protein
MDQAAHEPIENANCVIERKEVEDELTQQFVRTIWFALLESNGTAFRHTNLLFPARRLVKTCITYTRTPRRGGRIYF